MSRGDEISVGGKLHVMVTLTFGEIDIGGSAEVGDRDKIYRG
ncbi:MAG: hypothetical protein QXU67_04805 [Candidatus Bathyarchaeia archaeon]